MSIIEPKIDVLLNETDNDRFLLCALASKRAHDINDMMRGQRDRAIQLQTAVEIARAADKKPRRWLSTKSPAAKCRTIPTPSTSTTTKRFRRPTADGTARRCEAPRHRALPLQALVAYGSTLPRAFAALQGASGLLADVLRQPACSFRATRDLSASKDIHD